MPAKKKAPAKKRIATKVAEAAPKYTARSSVARPKRPRKPKSPGEEMWAAFLKLPDEEQGAFIRKMLAKRTWREDLMDICRVIARRGEPTRPFSEFIAELDAERRK